MAYNILGISPHHNGSVALISDGKLITYIEEERVTKLKRDSFPLKSIINILTKYKIDEIAIGGYGDSETLQVIDWTEEDLYSSIARKYNDKIKINFFNQEHHLSHAITAFKHSGFEEAASLVIDGSGSRFTTRLDNLNLTNSPTQLLKQDNKIKVFECESIFIFTKNNKYGKPYYKSYGTNDPFRGIVNLQQLDNTVLPSIVNDSLTITKTYEGVTTWLGWHPIEGGKTMGLAPYGKDNPIIPNLFKNGRALRDLFIGDYPMMGRIYSTEYPWVHRKNNPKEWHYDPTKITQIEMDLAWQVQNDTQEEVAKLIQKIIDETGLKQICCSGGYFLNCVTNYYLLKRFPNIDFYFEPISHDGGISLGAAYLAWDNYTTNPLKPSKATSLYLGPKYKIKHLKKSIKNYNNMFNVYDIKPKNVAKLISENNIVTIFQGRSEAGPRALGNRSILYNPTDPNGKDFVNQVKKREWFRPFAGSVLKEKAHEWFDMAGLEESPFMMYAMDVWPDKQETIKAITHVDGTCRIQTVTEEQNPHYYKLIQEFEKITGVPILFNTSFNLAGDPLVETIEDALETMLRSEMKYMYVPELGYLLEKK